MNKVLLSLLCLLFLASCSNGFENEAKKHMEKTVKELAKDPSSIQISNVETVFSNDSVCILHFKSSGKNGFGGVASTNFEYAYVKGPSPDKDNEKAIFEVLLDLEDKTSILADAKKSYQNKELEPEFVKGKDEDTRKAWHIYMNTMMNVIVHGREVKDESSYKEDIKNW